MTSIDDLEIVDDSAGLVFRRVVVGPLDTNCWIVATNDTRRAVVIDPGDEPSRLIGAVVDFSVAAIICTHTHWDHVLALPTVADEWGCAVHLHPDDGPVWPAELLHLDRHGHFDAGTATAELLDHGCTLAPPSGAELWSGQARQLRHGQIMRLDGRRLEVIHTPGHTPGSASIRCGNHVFTGDTLFPGGPGLTGWPFSDFSVIIESIRHRLFTLADETVIHPGHGRSTDVAAERPHLAGWIERGW